MNTNSRALAPSGGSSGQRELGREDLALSDFESGEDPIARELREIRDLRRNDRRAYNKNTKMQERERELLQAQSPTAGLDAALLDEWRASGGITFRLGRAQAHVNSILDDVADRQEFEDAFDDLPGAVQSGIFAEMALGSDTHARSATDDEVKQFASTPEGKALVGMWGKDAARKVGIVQTRIARMMTRAKDPRDVERAQQWFNNLSSRDAKAVLKELAG